MMALFFYIIFMKEGNQMEELKQLLIQQDLTCIVRHHHTLFKEKANGIQPLLRFIEQGVLENSEVIDKVIGKAAALLMVYGNVSCVHALTISEHALQVFRDHHIPITFDVCVPYIINRKKDGMCPMEQTVLSCNDADKAYELLLLKSEELRKTKA